MGLKIPGFTLCQVPAMLDEHVSTGQLRGMLRLRQAGLRTAIAAGTSRLA